MVNKADDQTNEYYLLLLLINNFYIFLSPPSPLINHTTCRHIAVDIVLWFTVLFGAKLQKNFFLMFSVLRQGNEDTHDIKTNY